MSNKSCFWSDFLTGTIHHRKKCSDDNLFFCWNFRQYFVEEGDVVAKDVSVSQVSSHLVVLSISVRSSVGIFRILCILMSQAHPMLLCMGSLRVHVSTLLGTSNLYFVQMTKYVIPASAGGYGHQRRRAWCTLQTCRSTSEGYLLLTIHVILTNLCRSCRYMQVSF